jgi:hypothetical protein
MFGLNPLPFYGMIALLISNVLFIGLWQFADLRADKQEALVMKCAADHKAFKDQVESSGRIAQAQAKQKEAEHEKLIEDTAKGWSAAIAAVRADAAQRVRNATKRSAGSGSLSKVPQDRPGDAVPDAEPIPAPERVAADCAETTVTANFLQSYIEQIEAIHE